MRKLLTLFLVLLFMTSMTYQAFGLDYREAALAYLTEKYGVPKEKIELYEGGITKLEFTAESFWSAKYIIASEGKSVPGASKGEQSRPSAEPMPLPAPDMPFDSGPATMPMPPQDTAGQGYIDGGIYIRIKTGEILEMNKMEPFFTAENQLAQQEWERLRKEAGKLDVSLYRKLQGLTASEEVTVLISPVPVETDELKAQFEALKKKYPEHTKGMELSQTLSYGYGYDLPAIRGGSSSSSSGSSGSAVSKSDAAVSYAVPQAQVNPALPVDKTDARVPDMPNEKYMQEYNDMWKQMDQIRLQAVTPSLAAIKKTLDSMGVTYQNNGTSIAAGLTAEQIKNVATLSAVSAIYENAAFTAMDAGMPQLARNSAPDKMMAASAEAKKVESPSSYLPHILITAALLTAALVIYFRSISRTR